MPEQAFPASPVPLTGGKVLATPFQFYVTGEDKLVLVTWSSVVCTVAVEGRWWASDGRIEAFRHTFVTNGTAVAESHSINVQQGFLLNCALDVISGFCAPGQCFAQLLIGRGQGTTFIKLGVVLQGYIATSKFLGFPGSPLEDSLSGVGFRNNGNATAVAAGTDWAIGPSTGRLWRVYTVFGTLTTSGVAGNRQVCLNTVLSGGAARGLIEPVLNQPLGTTVNYTWAPGFGKGAPLSAIVATNGLPDPCFIPDLTTLRTLTLGLLAGDQWATMRYYCEEWLMADTLPEFVL